MDNASDASSFTFVRTANLIGVPTKRKGYTLLIKSQEALVDTNTETQNRCRTNCHTASDCVPFSGWRTFSETSKPFRVRIDDQINHVECFVNIMYRT